MRIAFLREMSYCFMEEIVRVHCPGSARPGTHLCRRINVHWHGHAHTDNVQTHNRMNAYTHECARNWTAFGFTRKELVFMYLSINLNFKIFNRSKDRTNRPATWGSNYWKTPPTGGVFIVPRFPMSWWKRQKFIVGHRIPHVITSEDSNYSQEFVCVCM